MKNKNKFLSILPIIFFYLNIIVCMIATFASWSVYIDNDQILKAFLLLFVSIVSFFLSYYVIDTILHELGHLILGIIFDWKIYSFNVFGIGIERKNKKYKTFKAPINGLAGYVEMVPKSEKQNIVLPMLGGIIMNLILVIVFILIALLTNNPFVLCISLSFIFGNLLSAIINSIPFSPTSITKTDMYQLIEIKESIKDNTFKYYIKVIELYNVYKKKQIKDIDDSYFLLDVKDNSPYINMLHLAYIDKLIALEEFDRALERINASLRSNAFDENNKINMSFEKLFCLAMIKDDIEKCAELYNSNRVKENEKSLEYAMAIELYAYHKIVSRDHNKEKYYKDLADKRITNTNNKYEKQTLMELLKFVENK